MYTSRLWCPVLMYIVCTFNWLVIHYKNWKIIKKIKNIYKKNKKKTNRLQLMWEYSMCFKVFATWRVYECCDWQDGIKSASTSSQMAIQSVVHRIYEQLVSAMAHREQLQSLGEGTRQRLLLLTIFALSVKYQPLDVSLAVNCGMLPLLSNLCGTPVALSQATHAVVGNCGQSQITTVLQVASMRLLQILSITAG